MLEDFRRERPSQIQIVPLFLQCVQHNLIVGRIDHHGHRGEVLGRGTNHRWAANIDLLDHRIGRDPRCSGGVAERVEIDAHEVDGDDAVFGDRGHMLRQITARQETSVHGRVQRFHAAVEHLGKVCDGADVDAGKSGPAERLGGAAG